MNQLLAGADLPWDLIVGRIKLYRKSHDQIGRYRMGLGEKTASRYWGERERAPHTNRSNCDVSYIYIYIFPSKARLYPGSIEIFRRRRRRRQPEVGLKTSISPQWSTGLLSDLQA